MDQIFYGFLDLDIGDFFYNTRLKFYGIKVSRYMFFDINKKYLSKLDPKYITNEKIYIKYDNGIFERSQDEWIPVSKKLPVLNGYYLTSTMYNEVYCDYWNGTNFDRTEVIIAWQYLPKHY